MAKSEVVMLASSSAWLDLTIEAASLTIALAMFQALTPEEVHRAGWQWEGESIDRVIDVSAANGEREDHFYPATINRFHLTF